LKKKIFFRIFCRPEKHCVINMTFVTAVLVILVYSFFWAEGNKIIKCGRKFCGEKSNFYFDKIVNFIMSIQIFFKKQKFLAAKLATILIGAISSSLLPKAVFGYNGDTYHRFLGRKLARNVFEWKKVENFVARQIKACHFG